MTAEDVINIIDPYKFQCSRCKKWLQIGNISHTVDLSIFFYGNHDSTMVKVCSKCYFEWYKIIRM